MAQLEQITEQIRKDAKQQAEAIHADAQKKLNEERQQALEEAQKKANAIIEHAKRQKGAIQDRVLAETERKERNACLAAKQDLVRRAVRKTPSFSPPSFPSGMSLFNVRTFVLIL